MPSLDIFNDDAFSVTELTASVNQQPYVPGQVGATGVFEEDGISTTTAYVEMLDGSLSMVEPTERGAAGETVGDDDRKIVPIQVPHYQRDDFIKADEVQNVRAFGSETELETVQGRVDVKTARHSRSLDVTLEHQRVGAIKGVVTSKSGKILTNLFTAFDITPPSPVVLDLDNTGAELRRILYGELTKIEDDLEADTYSELRVMCGKDFWIKLIDHAEVKETYLGTLKAAELRGTPMNRFEYGEFVFERYRNGGKATAANGGSPFIATDEGRLIPMGVPELFLTRYAPADYEETVNTVGVPRYAKQWPSQNGKGRHLEVQSNPISICTRPQGLRQFKVAA